MPRGEKKPDFLHATFLDKHRVDYLASTEGDGGYKVGWMHSLHRDLLALFADDKETKSAEQQEVTKDALVSALMMAADGRWEKSPPPYEKQPPLFTVAGVGIDDHYNFPDPWVPGGHRRVLGRYANVWHVEQENEIRRIKAEQSVAAYKKGEETVRLLLERTGGDRYIPIWNFRDGKDEPPKDAGATVEI